jgi:tripartite-type tricarboxylate transporter receptor subunit TctC
LAASLNTAWSLFARKTIMRQIHRVTREREEDTVVRRFSRRKFIAASLAIGAGGNALRGFADSYPSRPVRYVVAYAAGGTSDLIGRLVAKGLSARLGQQVFVDNRPGAGGAIGVEFVAKSPPDGYTLLHTSVSFFTITPVLAKVSYDPEKDFDPVAFLGTNVDVLAVNPELPVKTLEEFLSFARANSGKLFYGSSGAGTGNHIECEYLKRIAKFDATHVPYKGAAPAILDLVSGRTQFMTDPGVMPYVASGKLRAIAVIARNALPQLPGVPPIRTALPEWNCPEWYNFISAPKGVPADIKARLNAAIPPIVNDPDTVATMLANNYAPGTASPDELVARIHQDYATTRELIRTLKISLE